MVGRKIEPPARNLLPVLMRGAACIEADPSLFDATGGVLARYALDYCRKCDVKKECEQFVNPKKSFFEGVCGGKVWLNGRNINLLYRGDGGDRIMA